MTPGTRPAIAYLIFALLGLLLMAPLMPPFRNADELAHALRADQISHFGFFAKKLPDGEHGGLVDSGINIAAAPFHTTPFVHSPGVPHGFYGPLQWGDLIPAGFPNTAIYPPPFYAPAAIALLAARFAHLTVLQGMGLARLATGAATIAIGALAIWLCGSAAIFIYALMLLPMSLALTAALSQDGPMLACTALAAALVRMQQARTDRRLLLCLVMLLALVGAARPPYAGFALLLLTLPIRLRTRLLCVSLVLACVVGWSALMAPHVVLAVFPDGAVNPRAQLLELVQSPLKLLTIAQLTWHAHASEFATGFIGKLGWLDVDLPQAYRSSAYVVLGLAALSCMARGRWKMPTPSTCVATLGIVISVAGILMAQYLTWTLPGRLVIEGVQGRYFLPPAIMLAALLPARGISRSWPSQLEWPVVAFPIITLPVMVHAVVLRYYF